MNSQLRGLQETWTLQCPSFWTAACVWDWSERPWHGVFQRQARSWDKYSAWKDTAVCVLWLVPGVHGLCMLYRSAFFSVIINPDLSFLFKCLLRECSRYVTEFCRYNHGHAFVGQSVATGCLMFLRGKLQTQLKQSAAWRHQAISQLLWSLLLFYCRSCVGSILYFLIWLFKTFPQVLPFLDRQDIHTYIHTDRLF